MASHSTFLRLALFFAITMLGSVANAGIIDAVPSWHTERAGLDATQGLTVPSFDWNDSSDCSQFDSASSWGVVGGPGSTLDFSAIHATWSYVTTLAFHGLVYDPGPRWSDSPCYSLLKVPRSSD